MMPSSALERSLAAVMRRMEGNHPRLFRNLAALKPAVVLVETTDLPHRFVLSMGGGRSNLSLLSASSAGNDKPHATIKGSLASLINMLEGRTDGDALFFSRELVISGDTAVIVALRNTLDRESIDLSDEFLSVLGPFAAPAARVIGFINRLTDRMAADASSFHDGLHRARGGGRDLEAECDALRAEMTELKAKLAKQEARQRRNAMAA